ncbi:alginate export family protein [Novosphingobium sp. BL-8H]|uniref:alginate export family protein n=1 Tax=Novosphingobium sp. BL-8H TaxID=3127640 RepID=UPI003756A3F8
MRNRIFPLRDRGLTGCVTIGLLMPGCAFAAAGDDVQPVSAQTVAPTPQPTSPQATSTQANSTQATSQQPALPGDPLKSPYPAEASGQGPKTGPNYMMLRGAEDWRFLRGTKAKRDWASPLKFIPLDGDGDVSLTLNGDQRSSVSLSTRPLLSDTTDRVEVLSRTTVGADLRIGPAVRFYGELASGQIFGKNENKHIPIQKNDLIVQQLFAEIRAPIAGGVARMTVGRQEFFDGPRFIISPRENPNIRVSMNGARLSMDWSRFRFTAFYFEPTEQGTGWLDDGIGNGEQLSGIYSSFLVSGGNSRGKSTIHLDPFYYHFEDDDRTLGRLTGKDRRETYGARLWGHLGAVAFDWSAMKQDGRFGTRAVDAWGVSTNQSVAFGQGAMAPRLGFHADYASGGGTFDVAGPNAGKVGSFNFLYNATVIFSDDNYIGAVNMMDVSPTLIVPVTKKLQLTGETGFYWRPNESDAVYRGNSQVYAGTQNVAGRHVANIGRLKAQWTLDPHVALAGIVNYVDAGKVLRRAGYGDNLFVQTMMTLRF